MSTILASAVDPEMQSPRSRTFWVVLGALATGQLFAFFLLCSHQMRVAEARQNEATVQQMALADCLQYVPGSTIASCHRAGAGGARTAQVGAPMNNAVAGAQPVGFSYR